MGSRGAVPERAAPEGAAPLDRSSPVHQVLSAPDSFAAWVARASINGGLRQS